MDVSLFVFLMAVVGQIVEQADVSTTFFVCSKQESETAHFGADGLLLQIELKQNRKEI